MFGAAGTLLNTSKRLQNQGKVRSVSHLYSDFPLSMLSHCLPYIQPVRHNVDAWDEMMMDRDKRLTGHKRGQQVRVYVYEFPLS